MQRFLTLLVPVGRRSDSKDRFRVQRVQLRDMCFRFLEQSITFQFFCVICVMLLVLCTVATQSWSFINEASRLTVQVTGCAGRQKKNNSWNNKAHERDAMEQMGKALPHVLIRSLREAGGSPCVVRNPSGHTLSLHELSLGFSTRATTPQPCLAACWAEWCPRRKVCEKRKLVFKRSLNMARHPTPPILHPQNQL